MDKAFEAVKNKWHIFVLIMVVILVSWPALFMTMSKGHDMVFHLQRLEGILSEVSLSNFPVRMQSEWVDGYGRPVSIFYGDIFLYVYVVLRKLGMSIVGSYRVLVILINVATVLISYVSFEVYFKDKAVAVITTTLYTTAAYRLVDIYVRAAVGEYLALTFFPAVAACIYYILKEDDRKKIIRAVFCLACAFSGIVCSHVLSTSMMLVILFPSVLVALFMFCKRGRIVGKIIYFAISGMITGLLSAFYIIPFLDEYLYGDIYFRTGNNIQGQGLVLRDFFDFFRNPFDGPVRDIQKTPGFALMTLLVAAIAYCVFCFAAKKRFDERRRMVFEIVVSLVLLFMTSRIFPWNWIEENAPLGGFLTSIQFPMRWLSFGILFITLAAGDLLLQLKRRMAMYVYSLLYIICLFTVVNHCVFDHLHDSKALFDTVESLGRWNTYNMEYTLNGTWIDDDIMPQDIKTEGVVAFELLSRKGNDFLMAVTAGPEYGWIQLPEFNYKYFHADDAADPPTELEIHDGYNRTVGILFPSNYVGVCHVYWKEPFAWRVSELVSLITVIVIVGYLVYDGRKNR